MDSLLSIPKLFAIILLLIILLAYIITNRWYARVKEYLKEDCCHLEGLPILGSVLLTLHFKDTKDCLDLVANMIKLIGDAKMASMWFLHKHYVIVRDATILEKIFLSPHANGRTPEYSVFRALTKGLFMIDGERWKKLRRVVNKTFTPDNIDNYLELQGEKAQRICKVFGKTDGFVNVQPFIARLFLDTILKTHFGLDINETEENKYHCMELLDEMQEMAFANILPRPYLYNDFLYWRTKWVKRALKLRKGFYRPIELATEKRYPEWLKNKEMNGNIPKNSIMLDYYFQIIDELNLKQCNRTYNELTSDIIVAGSDTSAVSTSACLYFLAFYSEWQEKVYQEIQEHWPDDTELTKEICNKFTYMDMCIRETLRIISPVGLFRPALENIYISKNCTIPKGSTICMFVANVHESTKYYKYPHKFYPEHFLPEAVEERPKCAFLPFSYGPRGCPGTVYAYQAMKLIIGHILKEFRLETNLPFEQVEMNLHLMKQFHQGYPIKFTRRKAQS